MDKRFWAALLPAATMMNSNVDAAAFDACPYTAFLLQEAQTKVYGVNLSTGAYQTLQTNVGMNGNLNAAGFNETDNYIYAYNTTSNQVVKVSSDFTAVALPVTNLLSSNFFVGDVHNNIYYLYRYGKGLYQIQLDSTQANYLNLVKVTGSNTKMRLTDFAFHPADGNIYAIDNKYGYLYRIDPMTGNKTTLGNAGVTGTFGAAYFEASGQFYFSRNQDGNIYTIDISDPNNIIPIATLFAKGPNSGLNDGVRCASAPAAVTEVDLGDAPDSYLTAIADNGPRHDLTTATTLYLGTVAGDAELIATESDDSTGVDDEDGVIFTSLENGETSLISVTANDTGYLNAWVDWNQDGDFLDNNEKVFDSKLLNAGMTSLFLNVPDFVSEGQTWARFRFSSLASLPHYGGAPDGEVEDYAITLENSQLSAYNYGPFTAAFEDSWPIEGDFDLNDVVMRYSIEVKADPNYNVSQITLSGTLQAMGADYFNGFAIHLPELARSVVNEADILFTKNGVASNDAALETGQSNVVLVISEDLRADTASTCRFFRTQESCQEIERFTFSLTIPLQANTKLWALPAPPYDPFIFGTPEKYHGDSAVTGRALEIHLDDYEPTDLGVASINLMTTQDDNSDLGAGSVYRTENGLPWGFIITESWVHPKERIDMLNAYPNFFSYATQGSNVDWYTGTKRISAHLYGLE